MTYANSSDQRGLGILGFLLVLTAFGILGSVALKAFPAYMEYLSVQATVTRLAHDATLQTDRDIRTAFDRQMQVDYIRDLSSRDLEISAGSVVMHYQKKIQLTDSMALLVDFDVASKP